MVPSWSSGNFYHYAYKKSVCTCVPLGGRGAAYRPGGAGGPSHGPSHGPRGHQEGWETVPFGFTPRGFRGASSHHSLMLFVLSLLRWAEEVTAVVVQSEAAAEAVAAVASVVRRSLCPRERWCWVPTSRAWVRRWERRERKAGATSTNARRIAGGRPPLQPARALVLHLPSPRATSLPLSLTCHPRSPLRFAPYCCSFLLNVPDCLSCSLHSPIPDKVLGPPRETAADRGRNVSRNHRPAAENDRARLNLCLPLVPLRRKRSLLARSTRRQR
jgi:hypothetical protein